MTGSIPRVAAIADRAGQPVPDRPGGLVLVLNSGSSSVKFALLAPGSGERVLGGMAEKVGTPEAVLMIARDTARLIAAG